MSDRRLRVAMVTAGPFPANHGTPGSIKEMAAAVARAGHEVHVVCYPFGEGEDPDGIHVHRTADFGCDRTIVVGPTWQKPLLDLLMIFTLWRVIRRERIDVIHAHNYEGALVGFFCKLLTGRPLVYNAINTMIDELPSYGFIRPRALATGLARALDRVVPRMADRIMAISPELTDFLAEKRIPDDRVEMIPLGVDLTPFDVEPDLTIRDRYSIPDGRLVLYTGILDDFQRVDYLVRAMAVVADACPDARLVLATNLARDVDVEACRSQIRDLGLEGRVDILFDVPFEAVPHLLAAAEVAVVSRPDCPGFPVKLLNYMAAARPIVACRGSAKGLTDMKNAIVTADHDWRSMGRGIVTLLESPGFAAKLGREARRHAIENFTWPALTPRIEAVYDHVLAPVARREAMTEIS